jgi:hypothetical protein
MWVCHGRRSRPRLGRGRRWRWLRSRRPTLRNRPVGCGCRRRSGRSSSRGSVGCASCRTAAVGLPVGDAVGLARGARAPATAIGDVAELLDVDVDQLAGPVRLVAADLFTGGPVDMPKPVDPARHQHSVHRRGRQPDSVGDRDRAQPLLPAQTHDPAHHRRRGASRRTMRSGGTIDHPGQPGLDIAACPSSRGRPGDLEPLEDLPDGVWDRVTRASIDVPSRAMAASG